MPRIIHAAAALALIAVAVVCLAGLAVPQVAADDTAAAKPCEAILCMFAVS